MPRVRAHTVTAITEDFVGKKIDENQAQRLAETLSNLVNAVDKASNKLPLESEPSKFSEVLEELRQEHKS
tara:strand:- start:4 stop:213 length:210 start_codon:yes stop_codon:yes gene_type:complete